MNKNYFDTMINETQTSAAIVARGLILNDNFLRSIGICPIEYPYPVYNADTHTFEPVGAPHAKEGDPTTYVQDFAIVELTSEDQQANLNHKVESKRKAALSAADSAVAGYMDMFSEVERSTWPKQQAEVEAISANPEAATPTLDALAQARGITREAQIEKAKAKVTAFVPLSAFIIGTQQGYEDKIKAIATDESKTLAERMAELDGMAFDYSMPEGTAE